MRTIIAGSRSARRETVFRALEGCPWASEVTTVLSGGASGADEWGASWARSRGLPVEVHPADWDRYGRSAGPRRNREMSEQAEALIAIWDGVSRGTKNMIDEARARGLRVYVVTDR